MRALKTGVAPAVGQQLLLSPSQAGLSPGLNWSVSRGRVHGSQGQQVTHRFVLCEAH